MNRYAMLTEATEKAARHILEWWATTPVHHPPPQVLSYEQQVMLFQQLLAHPTALPMLALQKDPAEFEEWMAEMQRLTTLVGLAKLNAQDSTDIGTREEITDEAMANLSTQGTPEELDGTT